MTYIILKSNVGSYWFILRKYDVYTSNSLQDMRQNHLTVKDRSCWLSLHDTQVHVTRLSHIWPTICINCFHNRKVEKQFLKVSYILTSSPTLRHGPWSHVSWNTSSPKGNDRSPESNVPMSIYPKTLCNLSPTPMMLHIKFDQAWPTGFGDIKVQKCEIFVPQGQVTPKWVVWFGPKSNLIALLCLS